MIPLGEKIKMWIGGITLAVLWGVGLWMALAICNLHESGAL